MLPLRLMMPRGARRILCLGAHADDIEIGCAGTILDLLASHENTHVHWVVMGATGARGREAETSARRLCRRARSTRVEINAFRDGYFPSQHEQIKEYFESLKSSPAPDMIFTHEREDRHQDHRLVCELTWNTYRNHLILEYEVPKFDGGLRTPNLYVPIEDGVRRRKVQHLLTTFRSQQGKSWFSEATFDALMRLRGIEAGSTTGYAEGFHAPKLVLSSHGRPRGRS